MAAFRVFALQDEPIASCSPIDTSKITLKPGAAELNVSDIIPAMVLDDYFRQYGLIAIFCVVAVAVPVSMLLMSWGASRIGLRPRKPSDIKAETYECGMEAIGGRWDLFNFRYYMFAILFVIFDVEVIFLYPWATKFLSLELFALIEMAVFVGILLIGWAYAWRKRDLEWS